MSKITIPFREYNAMRISRVVLWIAFIWVIFVAIVIVTMLCLIGNWVDSVGTSLTTISPIAFLCVALLLLRKYRVIFFTISFYLLIVYYLLFMLSSGLSFTHTSSDIALVFLLLAMLAILLLTILLTFRTVRGQNIPFARWVAVAYALFRIASSVVMIVLILANLSVGLPEATPQNISLFIVKNLTSMLPELLFAYFGYKAFSDSYYRYFISQPLSRVIRENTILFS
ncbi:hypothetical protein CE91St36_07210 [Christensenellaceae bacterium]|nr:hypothetical protein CE91St36_07210 [Christensenellaceae bacterium]BDF60572.1 hypothetical protein CE91St37_07220 [Christensenellaceae bacterium]